MLPRDGDQLRLGLTYTELPWYGRSPRDLTKAALAFRLAPEGTSWPDQGDTSAVLAEAFDRGEILGS